MIYIISPIILLKGGFIIYTDEEIKEIEKSSPIELIIYTDDKIKEIESTLTDEQLEELSDNEGSDV